VEEFWKTVLLLTVSKQASKQKKIGNRRERTEMLLD
jgi:hypothetical protein